MFNGPKTKNGPNPRSRANARSINGGLIVGPVALEADLARRLLDDARLAAAVEGEFPCQIHIHADTFNDWHADLEPPGWTAVFSGASAWMYKIVIYLQDHPDRDGFSVVPGSHKEANTPRSPLHVSTRAGDIVVFDHSGTLAGFPTASSVRSRGICTDSAF
jgi:hypothetical protein